MPRQIDSSVAMLGHDCKFDESRIQRQLLNILRPEIENHAPQKALDGDFLDAGGAEKDGVGGITQFGLNLSRNGIRGHQSGEESDGVEQELRVACHVQSPIPNIS